MKATELRDKSNSELNLKIRDINSEMMNLRFQDAKKVLENPARIKFLRRNVARIETVLKERALSGSGGVTGKESK